MKLNHFQKAMLLWERRHPYNAVHAVRLRGRADAEALKHAIQSVCRASGIGELSLNKRKNRYTYLPSFSAPLLELPPSDNPEEIIRQVADESMNARFPAGAHHPIRWYVANTLSGDAHVVIAVYHHVAADAAGIEALLASVLRTYLAADAEGESPGLAVQPSELPADRRRPFRQYGLLRSYARTVALSWRVFWSRRPRPEQPGDDRTGVVLRDAPDGLFARLQRRCVQRGIGINDVFLAALATTIANHLRAPSHRPWRPRIVLGTVLGRRPKWSPDVSDFFGVSLSDVILLVDRPEDPIDEVACRIAAQTKACKSDPQAADAISDMRLFLAKLSWPFLRNSRQSYRRFFPVCAGVSTVFVNQARFGSVQHRVERYVRACPPGPVMPLVLAPTIWGARLEFTLVHRLSCIDSATADHVLEAVITALNEFAGTSRSAAVALPEMPKSPARRAPLISAVENPVGPVS